jgi:hypothetical protein
MSAQPPAHDCRVGRMVPSPDRQARAQASLGHLSGCQDGGGAGWQVAARSMQLNTRRRALARQDMIRAAR